MLGFVFNGDTGPKTLWLDEEKRDKILVILQRWLRSCRNGVEGIDFGEFRSVISKIRHAFISIPNGRGLLSPCNKILRKEPPQVFLHRNRPLRDAITDIRTFMQESVCDPTLCRELVSGWPDYVAIVDASGHGVGIVAVGENKAVKPTVARIEWPADIKAAIVSNSNPNGTITNSDLESAGAVLAWLVLEAICDLQPGAHVAIYSDNEATVVRIGKMKSKAAVGAGLMRILSLRLKYKKVSPLTPLHIEGKRNMITDVPSRSFGSNPAWHWKTNDEFLTNFNSMFPLPQQNSWSLFDLSLEIFMRVVCVLRMKASTLEEWRRLPRIGTYVGGNGVASSELWKWTHTWRTSNSKDESEYSLPLRASSELESLVEDGRSKLQRLVDTSRPLARRSVWPKTETPPK
jgi:hypothetical protein